jgi:hypothetical protein
VVVLILLLVLLAPTMSLAHLVGQSHFRCVVSGSDSAACVFVLMMVLLLLLALFTLLVHLVDPSGNIVHDPINAVQQAGAGHRAAALDVPVVAADGVQVQGLCVQRGQERRERAQMRKTWARSERKEPNRQ